MHSDQALVDDPLPARCKGITDISPKAEFYAWRLRIGDELTVEPGRRVRLDLRLEV